MKTFVVLAALFCSMTAFAGPVANTLDCDGVEYSVRYDVPHMPGYIQVAESNYFLQSVGHASVLAQTWAAGPALWVDQRWCTIASWRQTP